MENHPTFNVARVHSNIAVLKELTTAHPNPEILKQYSGWGGLKEAIYTPSVYSSLKNIISPEAMLSLKQTLRNAYFTPPLLVKFIYALLMKLNRSYLKILEPSAGHGAFFEYMPLKLRQTAALTAIESDDVSCRLLKTLYPTLAVHHTVFEQFHPDTRYDLIIGNPPYGKQLVNDPQHRDIAQFPIHHYFVAKCMRLLSEGGILAMVVPRYVLDNYKEHVRGIIADEGGHLLAAYRFPDHLFDDAKVTVDVVILQKAKHAERDWIKTRRIKIGDQTALLNQYFHHHPQHILGNLGIVEMWDRWELTCRRNDNLDLSAALQRCVSQFNAVKTAHDPQWIVQQLKNLDQQIKHLLLKKQQLLASNI